MALSCFRLIFMAQVTLNPTKDCVIDNSAPTTNEDGTKLIIGHDSGSVGTPVWRSLLQFDLSSIPSGATISAATLKLYNETPNGANSRVASVYRVKVSWTEATVTWNTTDGSTSWQTAGCGGANDREATDIGTFNVASGDSASYYSVTLTPGSTGVQGWIDGTLTNNGILVKVATETDDFHSLSDRSGHNTANKPELVITYTAPDFLLFF